MICIMYTKPTTFIATNVLLEMGHTCTMVDNEFNFLVVLVVDDDDDDDVVGVGCWDAVSSVQQGDIGETVSRTCIGSWDFPVVVVAGDANDGSSV